MAINIYKGTRPSEGAIALRDALRQAGQRSLILRAEGSTFRGKDGDKIINWGTRIPEVLNLAGAGVVLNNPAAVRDAGDKLVCLTKLADAGVPIVNYFTTLGDSLNYIEGGRGRIYARTRLNGHSGEGIVLILHPGDPQLRNPNARNLIPFPVVLTTELDLQNAVPPHGLVGCRLFTIGHVGKRAEYRAHVANGEVILLQRKVRTLARTDEELERDRALGASATSLVRNLSTGWVYSVNFDRNADRNVVPVAASGLQAIAALGLDFGAVDILIDEETRTARVLEVNTAPGLEGETTLAAYVRAFSQ
jgi:hypothetical protein